MKRLLFIALCCLLPLMGAAQAIRPVRGVVFDGSGVPMAGATLTAIGSTASQVSGTDGTFEMMVSPYTKFVEASKEGYITAQAEVDGSYLVFKLQVDKKYAENKAKAEEEARKAAEAENARLAAEAEAARLAAEKAEQERKAAEERKRIEEEKRIAAEKVAAEKAERDRLAAEAKAKADEEKRIAAEKAAAEKAEAAKCAAEEKARIAEEKRIAAEKAAAEKAEKARLAAEEKKRIEEEKRIAAEKAAAEKAERQRIAAEEKSKQSAVKASKEDDGSRLAKQEEAKAKVWQEAELRGYRSQVEFAFAMDGELMPYYNIHYIGGYQINNYFYVGAGVGLSIYGAEDVNYNSKYNSKGVGKEQLKLETLNYPVFAYFRANFIDNRCAPFFALSAGYRFGTSRYFRMPWGREADMNYKTSGMFVNPQFGLNLRMTKKMDIYFAVGYNLAQMPAAIYSPAVVTKQGEESRYPRVSLGSKFCHGFDLRLGFTF
ncbi:MAG: TonB-dependent receptor [Alistipes sp.]|nr:TonB-dependent receptor [Alistipes sp.]